MWKGMALGGQGKRHHDTTLIGTGTTIEGTVRFAGTLEIEGHVKGDVRADGDEHAVVRILPGGHVSGNVYAPVVVVNGVVTGNVFSSEHVELAAKAAVHGDVEYSLIEMSKGAQINGRLCYRAEAPLIAAENTDERSAGGSNS
jgi:cytoskeletal protein CcmA (bactofilin family)